MIRHRPTGRGHAYQLEPDQRVPTIPVAGAPIELRVTTANADGAPIRGASSTKVVPNAALPSKPQA